MTRAHVVKTLRDAAGDLILGSSVRVLEDGTGTPLPASLFVGPTLNDVFSNPFVCSTGIVDFYLDTPTRVRLGITPSGGFETIYDGVDVLIAQDVQSAAQTVFVPAGDLAATNVQAAIEELDAEKSNIAHTHPAADPSVSVVLSFDVSTHWKVVCNAEGALVTRTIGAASPSVFWLASPDTTTWQLGVTAAGAITTTSGTPAEGDVVFTTDMPLLLPTPDATYTYKLTVTNTGALVTTEA